MEIFNNYKDFIKSIESKNKNDDDFNEYLNKLNYSIIENYNLILENKKDFSITDDDIIFDNENEKNKITYYQKNYEDNNFKEILNLIKKHRKKRGSLIFK